MNHNIRFFSNVMIHQYRYLFVNMKVFNYSELHFSDMTFYRIHTLALLQPGGADYAHHITASPPRIENPAASLVYVFEIRFNPFVTENLLNLVFSTFHIQKSYHMPKHFLKRVQILLCSNPFCYILYIYTFPVDSWLVML